MSAVFNFKPTPLSLALTAQAVSLLFLVAPDASALTQVRSPNTSISVATPLDSYGLFPASSLIATGANTSQITMDNAGLTLQANSSARDIDAMNRSTVVIDSSRVDARLGVGSAIFEIGRAHV